MNAGTKVKTTALIALGVLFAATKVSAANKAADKAFFSKITDSKELLQDTAKTKAKIAEVKGKISEGNFSVGGVSYSIGEGILNAVTNGGKGEYKGAVMVNDDILFIVFENGVVAISDKDNGNPRFVKFDAKITGFRGTDPKPGEAGRIEVTVGNGTQEVSVKKTRNEKNGDKDIVLNVEEKAS